MVRSGKVHVFVPPPGLAGPCIKPPLISLWSNFAPVTISLKGYMHHIGVGGRDKGTLITQTVVGKGSAINLSQPLNAAPWPLNPTDPRLTEFPIFVGKGPRKGLGGTRLAVSLPRQVAYHVQKCTLGHCT